MATQVLIAHSGQRLQIDTSRLTTLDEFRSAVSRSTSIPQNCIIALVPPGKALRPQAIQMEKEIFVYDSRMTQTGAPGSPFPVKLEIDLPKPYAITNPPNDIIDTRSLESWQDLFRERRVWAHRLSEDCEGMEKEAHDQYEAMDNMLSCLDAAVANLESVVRATENKYEDLKKWAATEQTGYNDLVTRWEQNLGLARSIPISAAMVRLMTGKDVTGAKGRPSKQATLEDLVDLDCARKEGRRAPTVLRKFNARIADLEKAEGRLMQNFEELEAEFRRVISRSVMGHSQDATQLLQDIQALAGKVENDYRTTMDYSTSTRDLLQASKIAQTHTEKHLPSLHKRALEMDGMLRYAIKARNALALEQAEFMRSIADVSKLDMQVKSLINAIAEDEELATFDYLRLIHQVPYMYAAFTAEAIRRKEWFDKVKTDSTTLANEMALFQDEEAKRRRKWYKTIGDTSYGPESLSTDNNVPGLEVNLLGEDELWPSTSRKDLEEFLDLLQRQRADASIIGDVGKIIAELSNPTKQQFKRLKAFKNGSVHDSALGRSGLMIRGDDELLRSLQDDKTKLETKLRTAESRVRRLEDLLHRQGQASRPTLGNLFQNPSQQLPERSGSAQSVGSPGPIGDRRQSDEVGNQLVQRVAQLEKELQEEKERNAALERDAADRTTHTNDIKAQMDDVNATKKDLLENMEAQKREFLVERKALDEEIRNLKARLEETEDEFHNIDESREHEKTSYDEKVQLLEAQLESLTKEKSDDALKAQGQVDFLRNETRLQRESNEALQAQIQASQDELGLLNKKLKTTNEAADVQLRALRELYTTFVKSAGIPEDVNDLADTVLNNAAETLAKVQNLDADISIMRSNLALAQDVAKDLRAQQANALEKLAKEETTSMHLREQCDEHKAKVNALEGELADGRKQLDELRAQIAQGETGSESLRTRLEEEEKKIVQLTEDLASKQSQVGSLEEELRLFQERLQDSQSKLTTLTLRTETRNERTKDISQRLYSQNERLVRLLERLGFSVSRENGVMTIQKIPRAERSTMNLAASSTADAKSRIASEPADVELLYWMNATDVQGETEKYDKFMSTLGSFDVDAFADTVYRRVKDVEHIARKLQRDVRGYREKTHALHKDAHDKIAFRNFKEGDLALFLPTRNQTNGAWAAFNIGFPHYFLREQEHHRLSNREWLVARITRVQEKVVDLSKSLDTTESINGTSGGAEDDNDNPFDLSDGLRWYLIDAQEDKPGAPSTPGLGKTTVASTKVEAKGDMQTQPRSTPGGLAVLGGAKPSAVDGASKSLSKSLESRRSSTSSTRRPLPFAGALSRNAPGSETNSLRAVATTAPGDGAGSPSGPTSPKPHLAHGEDQDVRLAALPEPQQQRVENRFEQQQPIQRESPTKRSVVWDHMWNLDL
ncbi:oligomeric, coiled-coil, peripheral membrane protein, variant 2 [Pyricularia oryzae]|uniref:Autophagy-related protein 11 n=1 Tax=Pyricularia grisea TaxID=148305 RepID=A0ABQ8NWZ3_PYRGI|nr:oligomeric, coiled-coil, peripheral membrane protein, variant 2 [Pyricularia oryzae]KAI6303322.1 oligomeric, coiled-coil, peripheral membrane protein, variant 2 [Pyricularia grisea]KAH9429319.1 oligomeric, coiled-coil, peripheral membrane protein, variant 2 [Pyricularia oryzae]KAI6263762.1 oligomeric, coiled-coil, peripheral membrane protein, variant 2 [Pyricularia oryzae]KAI6288154.1 oligomeric, coiled-coil, peripheral membrane protein, variant 2 [Pyricularia oryzae]